MYELDLPTDISLDDIDIAIEDVITLDDLDLIEYLYG